MRTHASKKNRENTAPHWDDDGQIFGIFALHLEDVRKQRNTSSCQQGSPRAMESAEPDNQP